MERCGIKSYESSQEKLIRQSSLELFKNNPIPEDQILENLGLFLSSKNLSRILFLNHIYQKIIDIPGIIFDFGTRWGQNMAIFSALRGIYEPFNRHRKIIGFDTFTGFPSIHSKDGLSDLMGLGMVACTPNYEEYLEEIIKHIEEENPISHIKKFEIIKGDVVKTLPMYLENNPETIISLIYFDFDIYEPTKKCLKIIKDRLLKGSIIAFDELNDHDSPGETMAFLEEVGSFPNLKRYRYASRISYLIIE